MKYQLLPNLTDDEMAALTADIKERGVMVPVEMDDQGAILDGHHRVKIADSLGIDYPTVVRSGWTEAQKRVHVIALNAHRRHLTPAQKRDLNVLLRTMVVEVIADPETGEEMRIGLSRPARAAHLGVDPKSVQTWDDEDVGKTTEIGPTHIRRSGGNPSPYPIHPGRSNHSTRVAPKPRRTAPPWNRHFTIWCRAVLPEDRKFLLQMSDELHKALGRLDLTCGHEEEVA